MLLMSLAAGLPIVFAGAIQPPPERPERIDAANPGEKRDVATEEAPKRGPGVAVLPGLQPDGEVLLPNQWSLKPVGNQVELGDFPVNIALHPSKPFAAVLHAGHGAHEVVIVNLKTRQVVSRVSLLQAFYGITFDHAGTRVYASGCESDVVYSFGFEDGLLGSMKQIKVGDPKEEFVVAGVSLSADDSVMYVCGAWGHKVARVSLTAPDEVKFAAMEKNSYPYTALPSADRKSVYVSLWGGAGVAVLDAATLEVKQKWTTPSHPTEMVLSPDGKSLYVACSNSTQAASIDTETGRVREVINCALYPSAPSGNTPNSLALSPDGKTLAVANADNNNLAVFDVESPGRSHSRGFVPTGWYPTSVRFQADGSLVYASGKGVSTKANRAGPNPLVSAPGGVREYIGGLFRGTLGFVKPLTDKDLAKYTAAAYSASPLRADAGPSAKPRDADSPIPEKIGDSSPIKHCVYVIKENRTYDQVFGDIPQGNGDASLCIFGEQVTPNLHALVKEYVLLDNFYVESEVSADGHEWTMGAYATDFVEKTWPLTYRSTRPENKELGYPSEGVRAIATPAGGYLWDRCIEAGVSYRTYGEWIETGKKVGDPGTAKAKALERRFDPMYRGYDLDYPDVKRVERFMEELKRFEGEGSMPQMQVVRLGNDHTFGTRKDKPTPIAMVAENDLAVGMLIEGLSKSKFWATTAVFIVEDDAQNGSDHVDAHRTTALVISPYCKRKFVDSSLYSTSSMLRTMELILGVQPMSQFDAAALPMYHSFAAKPGLTPYTHRPARVDLNAKNGALAWGADLSETFDLTKEDAADDLLLNEVIWRSVRGPDSPMPPPVRAAFVFVEREDEEED